jgi:hypothetical protein
MIPSQEAIPAQFVAVLCKSKRTGRDELRFLMQCSDCTKIIFNIEEANIAVVSGSGSGKLKRIGTRNGIEMSRIEGKAVLLCWDCDRKSGGNVPWQNALATFRGLDEPQRYLEAEYIPTTRKSR